MDTETNVNNYDQYIDVLVDTEININNYDQYIDVLIDNLLSDSATERDCFAFVRAAKEEDISLTISGDSIFLSKGDTEIDQELTWKSLLEKMNKYFTETDDSYKEKFIDSFLNESSCYGYTGADNDVSMPWEAPWLWAGDDKWFKSDPVEAGKSWAEECREEITELLERELAHNSNNSNVKFSPAP